MTKTSRSSKKVTSRAKKITSRSNVSFLKNKFILVAGVLLLVFFGFKVVYKAMVQPSGINEITAGFSKQDAPMKVDANGCYEKQIQCVKAPCNPIMVCPAGVSPAPIATKGPEICTQEAGSCLNSAGQCVGYTDGCQKSKVCGKDMKRCDTTTKPSPVSSPISCVCPPGAICKLDARCNPSPTTKPTPTPTPKPTATPTSTIIPKPSPTPITRPSPSVTSCISKITSLSLKTSDKCMGDTFSSASYSCAGGTQTTLSMNGCLSATTIFTQVQSICGTTCQGK
jgi:hypothetical protein